MTAINSNRAIRGPVTAVPVVAGKGVRLTADTENNRWVVEADETVLFTSDSGAGDVSLSETPLNFERLKIYYGSASSSSAFGIGYIEVLTSMLSSGYILLMEPLYGTVSTESNPYFILARYSGCNTTSWSRGSSGKIMGWGSTAYGSDGASHCNIYKIVGINRIASN